MIVADLLHKKFIMMHIIYVPGMFRKPDQWVMMRYSHLGWRGSWIDNDYPHCKSCPYTHLRWNVHNLWMFKQFDLHSGFSNNKKHCSIAAICLFLSCRVLFRQLFASCQSAKSQLSCFRPVLTPRVSKAALETSQKSELKLNCSQKPRTEDLANVQCGCRLELAALSCWQCLAARFVELNTEAGQLIWSVLGLARGV